MPSLAAIATPATIGGSSSSAHGSGGEGMAISADFMVAFMATLKGMLDQQAMNTNGAAVPAPVAGSDAVKTAGQTGKGALSGIDPALVAALQQIQSEAAQGDASVDGAKDAASLIEQLLARLGGETKPDAKSADLTSGLTEGDASEDTKTDGAKASGDGLPAADILAALMAILPAQAQLQAAGASGEGDTLAIGADGKASRPELSQVPVPAQQPAGTKPDPAAAAAAKADGEAAFAQTLLALQAATKGENAPASPAQTATPAAQADAQASAPAVDTQQTAAVALSSTEAQPKPAVRSPATSRTEERMRRIASEIASLTGGAGISGPIEVTARARPVTPVAAPQAVTTDPQQALAQAAIGDGDPKPVDGTGKDTQPMLTAANVDPAPTRQDLPPAPTAPAHDPMAGAVDKAAAVVSNSAGQSAQLINHHALASAMMAHAARKETRFDIRLDPAELGKVDVTLDITASGTVRAHMAVERADTLDMMLRDQSSLTRSLEQAGFKLDGGGLEFSLKQDNGSRREPPQPPQHVPTGSYATPEEDDAVMPDTGAASRLYSRSGASGLDVRI